MRKRLFSILLALCMVLCLAPTTAFAEDKTAETPVCTCETACAEETMNAECPACGAVGALPESCAKCSGPVEDAAAEPEVEDNEVQPEASPVVLSGKREIKSEAELNVALGDKSCTEITLGGNIELSGGYIISHTVTLDLNGYTLTVNGDEWDIFSVYESGNLTVKDSGTGGKIDGQNKNCGFCIYGGVLTLESGTITNCMTDGDGSAVDISYGGSERVYGKFVMNGGAITNCKATDDGGAVDIGPGCTFIMNSGTISGCRADDDAGAIFIKGNASFVMNGGTIENCSAGFWGGAVNIRDAGSFTMTGGTIDNCTVDEGGSGNAIYGKSDKAIVAITGGTIENCGASPLSFDIFTVSFDSDGGTPVAEQKVLNTPAVRPDESTKTGYTFSGWNLGEEAYDFTTRVTENLTLTAKWTVCDHTGSTAKPTCTEAVSCTLCGETLPATGHSYTWRSGDGMYWQQCGTCQQETAKKAIPQMVINGADRVCRTQDYTFTFALPQGCQNPTYGYDFMGLLGDGGLEPDLKDGVYSATITTASYYTATGFQVTASAKTEDGFAFTVTKDIAIVDSHTGGVATCVKTAVCQVCGESYGEVDSGNHAGLARVAAKAATTEAEGNIEYWHCADCGKYFRDAAAGQEITLADTVTAKLPQTPQTGDNSNLMLWVALLAVSGGAAIAATVVVIRKKKHNR